MASNQQIEMLQQDVPADAVSEREGPGGRRLSYVEGAWVIDELNRIFGNAEWGHEIVRLETTYDEIREDSKAEVGARCIVRLTVNGQPSHDGVGHGRGIDRSPAMAHESADKEAETDALKRAAKNLGRRLGLSLYLHGKAASRPSESTEYKAGKSDGGDHTPPPSTSGRAKTPGSDERMRFGKYKGDLWADIPDHYLDYILEKFDNETIKNLARGEQERRGQGNRQESQSQPQDGHVDNDGGPPAHGDDDIPF